MALEGHSSQVALKARDAFYTCLDSEAKPTEIASVGLLFPTDCKRNREQYVNMCRPAWVKHFDREYCVKKRWRRLLDDHEMRRGRLSLPQSSTSKSSSCCCSSSSTSTHN